MKPVMLSGPLVLLLSFLISQTSRAQVLATSQASVRDPQAMSVIQQAITAMGGVGALATIQDVIATGRFSPAGDEPSRIFTWKYKWDTGVYESWLDTDPNGQAVQFSAGSKLTVLVTQQKDRVVFPRTQASAAVVFLPSIT